MSRLTGNDAKEMLEAYQAVYAPQELTEEQVWEEVENWVHSLLEEGYDLSEYTWEEMYEAYVTEAIPLAIPAAMAAAPYVLPALGAAAYTAKALMNRGKTKNTPEEERFLNTGSFASSKETAAQRKARIEALRQRAAERSKTTSLPTPTKPAKPTSRRLSDPEYTPNVVRSKYPQSNINPQPKPPAKPPESPKPPAKPPESPKPPAKPPESPKPPSSGGTGAVGKPPGYGEKLRQRMQSDAARRTAEREARRARPNPIGQAVQDTAVDLTARGLNKLATGLRRTAVGAGIAGLAGAADQGLMGGVVGKSARDFTNWTRQAGPAYDKFMNRGKGTTPPKPQRGTPPEIKEKVDPIEIYNRQGNLQKVTPGKGYPITKGGKRGYVVYDTSGKPKFTEYPTQPTPAAQSPAPKPPTDPGAKQPGESLKDYAIRTEREASKTQPPATPAAQPPAAQPPAAQPPAPRQQAPAPAQTQRPPAPKPQAPAQTGDRTKDLTTWALANKGMIDKVGTKSQREILKAAQTGGSMPAPRPLKASLKDSYDYDAFDFVLEYLLSEGHTDTLEEALYVMMEMDPETIQSICEGYQELNYKRRNRMTDQAMRHMSNGDDESWEKVYSIENQRDTQTPEVSKAKAAANRARGAAKRGKG
jgi:hypothetical protein